jgi:hypothetical protein
VDPAHPRSSVTFRRVLQDQEVRLVEPLDLGRHVRGDRPPARRVALLGLRVARLRRRRAALVRSPA